MYNQTLKKIWRLANSDQKSKNETSQLSCNTLYFHYYKNYLLIWRKDVSKRS